MKIIINFSVLIFFEFPCRAHFHLGWSYFWWSSVNFVGVSLGVNHIKFILSIDYIFAHFLCTALAITCRFCNTQENCQQPGTVICSPAQVEATENHLQQFKTVATTRTNKYKCFFSAVQFSMYRFSYLSYYFESICNIFP